MRFPTLSDSETVFYLGHMMAYLQLMMTSSNGNNKMRFPTSSEVFYLRHMMDTLTGIMHADVQGLFH